MLKNICGAVICAMIFALSNSAVMADGYPSKPITVISPKAAGGAADLAARAFAVIAEKHIGQPVRVVNKPGGAGIPGIMSVKDAKPDGYTLMVPLSPWMLTAPIFKKKNPYKTSDFTYLSVLEEQPITYSVKKDSPHKDINSLVSAIKSAEKPVKVAVASKIGLMTMAYHALAVDLGVDKSKLKPIPYKNGPAAARALLAGDVDFASINLASVNASLKSGDARLLMVTTSTRNFAHPSTPTAKETNLGTVNGIVLWAGIAGPNGMPKEVIAKWQEVLPKIHADPDYISLLKKRGASLVGTLPDKTKAYIDSQKNTYQKLKSMIGS